MVPRFCHVVIATKYTNIPPLRRTGCVNGGQEQAGKVHWNHQDSECQKRDFQSGMRELKQVRHPTHNIDTIKIFHHRD